MQRRPALAALLTTFVWTTLPAQPAGRLNRLGLLISETQAGQSTRIAAFRTGLAEAGYVEGRNIVVDVRSADGRYDRLPALARELVALPVDVIVAFGVKALTAASEATRTIAVVVPATSSDLVALGLVKSLARPGGNITGSTTFGSEIMVERLELVKELAPATTRVAVLANPANAGFADTLRQMKRAAIALGLELRVLAVRSRGELARAFSEASSERLRAVVIQDDTIFGEANADLVAELASRHRVLAIGNREFALAGGAIGFGRSDTELYRRSARYVDRILKGARPGELPIEQATRFDLVINRRVTKALGVMLPQALLVRADSIVD